MATSGEETGDADVRKRQVGRDDGNSSDSRSDNKKQRRDNGKKGGQCCLRHRHAACFLLRSKSELRLTVLVGGAGCVRVQGRRSPRGKQRLL
jgi:hypothetical protein